MRRAAIGRDSGIVTGMTNPAVQRALMRFARNSRLLALLDDSGLERLAAAGAVEHLDEGVEVVREGEQGRTFYLVVAGEVRVLVEQGAKEVARLGAGAFFGEIAVMTKQPRSATVECTQPVEIIAFDREAVLPVLADYPKVREIIGEVGLQRTEANLQTDDELGLADLLEGNADVGAETEASAEVESSTENDPEPYDDDKTPVPR